MAKIAEVSLGENRLVVDRKDLTFDNLEVLGREYAQAKIDLSLYSKYPIGEDESLADWAERVYPLLQEDNKKKDDEGKEDFLVRIYGTNMDKHELVFRLLQSIASICKQSEKVTKEAFKKSSYPDCKEFIATVFKAADFPEFV